MMRWLAVAATFLIAQPVMAQISITTDDMPVHRDSLRFSNANPVGVELWAADSGANRTWNYTLIPTSQGLDEYKRPREVNPLLLGSPFSDGITADYAYGPKVADSIPGIGLIASGITISDLHTYYNIYTSPPCFVAEAFSANISILPVGTDYILPDVVYKLPLEYHGTFESDFHLKFGADAFGGIEQKGRRTTRVDGWGTITTPYFTAPKPCLRVRSEIVEIDSVELSGNSFGIERTTIEYRWLVKGEHQPALMISAINVADTEIVTTVRYKDRYRPELSTAASTIAKAATQVSAYPNPAVSGHVHIDIPASWKQYYIELFDAQGRPAGHWANTNELDITTLPQGNYLARITSGGSLAYVKIMR